MAITRIRLGQTGPYTPLDASDGSINGANRLAFYATPTADVTFVFTNCSQGVTFSIQLSMPTPAVVITWPDGVIWPGGLAPGLRAGDQGVYTFLRIGDQYYANLESSSAINPFYISMVS